MKIMMKDVIEKAKKDKVEANEKKAVIRVFLSETHAAFSTFNGCKAKSRAAINGTKPSAVIFLTRR